MLTGWQASLKRSFRRPHKTQWSVAKEDYVHPAVLMTTPVIAKLRADKHGIEETATTRDFRQSRIVLQSVWLECLRPIECLTVRRYFARPTSQAIKLIRE